MEAQVLQSRKNKFISDWLPSILLVVLLLAARSTLADHYHVPSGSMEYSLIPGDHVLVNKAAYGLRVPFTMQVLAFERSPQPGEVVVFDSPEADIRLIKRVVAIAGDHVQLHRGRLMINGQPLAPENEPLLEMIGDRRVKLNLDAGGGPDISSLTVPEGHVLVLGDHRGNSRDGRYFGTISEDEIYGRASGVFWRRGSGLDWHSL